jgi:hypothetical protein
MTIRSIRQAITQRDHSSTATSSDRRLCALVRGWRCAAVGAQIAELWPLS